MRNQAEITTPETAVRSKGAGKSVIEGIVVRGDNGVDIGRKAVQFK